MSNPKRPRDANQLAKAIVDIATGKAENDSKLVGKKADSRKGGLNRILRTS